jgi:hypothetical protein
MKEVWKTRRKKGREEGIMKRKKNGHGLIRFCQESNIIEVRFLKSDL